MKVRVPVRDFYPEHVFECGQCFRWESLGDGSYTGFARGRVVTVSFEAEGVDGTCGEKGNGGLQMPAEGIDTGNGDNTHKMPSNRIASNPGTLVIDNTTKKDFENIWLEYFDLNRDYGAIKKKLSRKDPVMKEAVKYGWGIRILKQEPWETIVSFIISANNNIPRIKKNIEDLARNFGEKRAEYRGKEYYDIPSPRVLASLTEEDLACCRLGYRAKYLIRTAAQVLDEGISEDRLLSYCGVGQKVADCISLFSMDGFSRFPVDTWVRKLMHSLYGLPEDDVKAINRFAKEKFGENGGIAQQYLFYYMRDRTLKGGRG